MAGIVLAAVVAGAVVAMFVVRSPGSHAAPSGIPAASTSGAANTGAPATGPSGTGLSGTGPASTSPATTTSPASEQTAATGLARLLAQSTSDRADIVSAYNDVAACGSGLVSDAQTFQKAATSRAALLAQLSTLPGASTLPSQMIQALTGAWQSSMAADQDYAAWARDESANGCTKNDFSNSHYAAAAQPNTQATADKSTFAGLWNPIAAKYGLTTYQQNEL